jgi:ribosomal protein S12 methylthiotransferase accessory factor
LKRYEDVLTLDDHSAFASLSDRRREFDFLWATGRKIRLEDVPNRSRGACAEDLAQCVVALGKAGARVAYVELTTDDVAAYDIHVVRVIATELQPIHFGHGQERLGGSRLFALPSRLGFREGAATAEDLNPCPHPLA